jgi:hypothetical protein
MSSEGARASSSGVGALVEIVDEAREDGHWGLNELHVLRRQNGDDRQHPGQRL